MLVLQHLCPLFLGPDFFEVNEGLVVDFAKKLNSRIFQLLVVLGSAVLVYVPSLGNGFVFSDRFQILENPWLRDVGTLPDIFSSHVWAFRGDPISNYYRPLMHFFNQGVYLTFGPDPFWFHLASLMLHLTVTVLLYLVVAELVQGNSTYKSLPFLTSLFFVLHPVNLEAVAWIASSADLLCALFGFLTVYLYLKQDSTRKKSWVPALGAWVAFLQHVSAKKPLWFCQGFFWLAIWSKSRTFGGMAYWHSVNVIFLT